MNDTPWPGQSRDPLLRQALGYARGRLAAVEATAFEQRVWRLLQTIPRGETRSYSAVAEELGQPRAVRAVARACARNPLALVVPCHRVVGKNGQLTGYRWGKERKEKLLALEQAKNAETSAAGAHRGGELA